MQYVNERDDEREPGASLSLDATQPEEHTLLILLDDLRRHHQQHESHSQDSECEKERGHGRRHPSMRW